jgi:hypothetical protein
LYDSYDTNADELLFHIPQLCTFLLHGKYSKQTQLECFMLDKCSSSVHWAHLLYWFINSFCMDEQSLYFSEGLSALAGDANNSEDAELIRIVELQGSLAVQK